MVFRILMSTSPNSQVDLLLSFCQQLKFSSVVLVGHDDSGLLALMAAANILTTLSSTQISPFARVLLHTSLGRHILRPLLCPEMASGHAWHDALKPTSKVMELYKFSHLNDKTWYSDTRAYSQSKLANFFHAKELAIRFKAEGVDITANAIHPGFIMTPLMAMRFKAEGVDITANAVHLGFIMTPLMRYKNIEE
ncbi:hypothetical protein SELMODRAFT_431536 [Selaginella moellendorffii]|uniref:Uncharacterized protein n=1 Tax=Selaginella moellendorffii TaxID=88036 RepID=D8TCZ4_SELML|nr:hypothetical protein SELMODRAFT_431536 [Selaginella moellendorffii]